MDLTTKLIVLSAATFAGLAVKVIGLPERGLVMIIPPAEAQQSAPKPTTVTAAGVTLRSVRFDFPASDRMFPGNDADAINNNCLACHSAGMVLTQPRLPRDTWQLEVEKMRSQFKAPVAIEDVPVIVAYLANHHGPQ